MQGNECLIDTRAQWEEEKLIIEELLAAYNSPISALRLPKIGKADGVQEIGNPLEDQPIQELDSQLDNHDREIACGLCMCRLLPFGRHRVTKCRGHRISSRESTFVLHEQRAPNWQVAPSCSPGTCPFPANCTSGFASTHDRRVSPLADEHLHTLQPKLAAEGYLA